MKKKSNLQDIKSLRRWYVTFSGSFKPCENEITETSGNITSSGWPNHYPINHYQCWNLTCNADEMVEMKFQSFDLEPHSTCKYD